MKTISRILALSLAGGLLAASAQTEVEKTTETSTSPDGSVSKTTTTTRTFTPEIETRVVEYFDEYKTEKFGLPPAVVEKVPVTRIPRAWTTTRVEPGAVITEEQREFLAPPPEGLIKVLPKLPGTTHRYYMMGGNVVAVDTESYKVVDSVRIPSVRFTVE